MHNRNQNSHPLWQHNTEARTYTPGVIDPSSFFGGFFFFIHNNIDVKSNISLENNR